MQLELRKPLSEGYDRMKGLLFRPFRAETWFTIGFAAFMVALGEGGGFNLPGNFLPKSVTNQISKGDPSALLNNTDWIGMLVGIVVVVVLFSVVLGWVSARGTFIFLANLAAGKVEVTSLWKEFAVQANSLFIWRMVVGFGSLLVTLPLLLFVVFGSVLRIFRSSSQEFPPWLDQNLPNLLKYPSTELIVGLGILLVIWITLVVLLNLIIGDFVVPFMYRHRLTVLQALGRVWPVVSAIPGKIILYGLFKVAVKFLLGIVILLAMTLTCFLLAIPLVIPYISSVFTLPITATFKYFNLLYLRQLGPEFDVFTATPISDPGLYVPPEARPATSPGDSENPYYPYKS